VAAEQTILLTPMPRGLSRGGATLPVSVFVTPRLMGEDKLGAYGDWVDWTRRVKAGGLTFDLRCGANSARVAVDTGPLDPALWEALFSAETLVRSHVFDDYSDRAILSYSVRDALSALKSTYQAASVLLALPSPEGIRRGEGGNRSILRRLISGFEVHWSPASGEEWRDWLRDTPGGRPGDGSRAPQELDSEGLVTSDPDPTRNSASALPFSVFHHMPTPPRDTLTPDWQKLIDFHQALAALNAYPSVQRALGIVFDLELPRDLVPVAAPPSLATLAISAVHPGWDWALVPKLPQLETACLHMELGSGEPLFLGAPRALIDPSAPAEVIGLLNLDPTRFGLAQVDVDGAMHKTIMLAETWHDPESASRNLDPWATPEAAPHPEVFDPAATLPALRSGGLSLYADGRARDLLDAIHQGNAFNDALDAAGGQPRPFFIEDLVRGYRLDVWDSRTGRWHSLHLRRAEYRAGEATLAVEREEGFVQLAAAQPAPGASPATSDLYLHEAIARWAGWSLSVPMPGKALSRYPDADRAVPPDNEDPAFAVDEPETPFQMTKQYRVLPGSLPRLRFGSRYRLRARGVDLAGNSVDVDDPFADALARVMGLPRDPEGFAYLRYEPVIAPLIVPRDPRAITGPGSATDRLVIRSFNGAETADAAAADTVAGDRHILPPRTSVQIGEHLAMFDTPTGELDGDPATWKLIGERDTGQLRHVPLDVGGQASNHPIEPEARIDRLPYLPDPLARGAAIRDLPGTPSGSVGRATASAAATGPISYAALDDPNPRPGSATIVEFLGQADWKETAGFRLVLAETAGGAGGAAPAWDAQARSLTVYLPKGTMTTVPLTSFVSPSDLALMGIWRWLREYVEAIAVTQPERERLSPGADVDRIAHVLQRAVEGGHWMLTPPRLLTLVHAVQQPIGQPRFTALNIAVSPWLGGSGDVPLETEPSAGRTDPTELAPITSWRRPGATDAYLMGALSVHGASTAKVDLLAVWDDPVDDVSQPGPTRAHHQAPAEELPLHELSEGYLIADGTDRRAVGYYDPEHDQIAFVRAGEWIGRPRVTELDLRTAAPRHVLGDTRHHRVTYTAVATSRYREYFDPQIEGGFTRTGEPVTVDVPASARPLAPSPFYVVPTFGWQRQVETNLKRSVRFGGGLRVYLHRPWFSSGPGELLGVVLWDADNGDIDRVRFTPFITQWGMDPIWDTAGLPYVPYVASFQDAAASDRSLTLGEPNAPTTVDVVGFEPEYDETRGLWFADLTIETPDATYSPFVRLALVRYQPNALLDSKLSRVVLADFAQLTPDRAATVTCDPYHPRRFRVAVSGVAPQGPALGANGGPTSVGVRVQQRDPNIRSDLAWSDVPDGVVDIATAAQGPSSVDPNLELWAGTVIFTDPPEIGRYRLLIEERERISGDADGGPARLIYAETFALEAPLVGP
jgi:hypothetical protein